MTPKSLFVLVVLTTGLFSSPRVFAAPAPPDVLRAACEAAHVEREFSRPPDDARKGFVTDRVPMTTDTLAAAYARGIFPWFVNEEGFGLWYTYPERGVMILDQIYIQSKDRKLIRRALEDPSYEVTFDKDFEAVIRHCREMVRAEGETWISEEHIRAYVELHRRGQAHSVEVWHDGRLVAGLYGVFVNGVYAGESMFHTEEGAGKIGLFKLLERLRAGGHRFIDTQMLIGLPLKWGGRLLPRAEFEAMLRQEQARGLSF